MRYTRRYIPYTGTLPATYESDFSVNEIPAPLTRTKAQIVVHDMAFLSISAHRGLCTVLWSSFATRSQEMSAAEESWVAVRRLFLGTVPFVSLDHCKLLTRQSPRQSSSAASNGPHVDYHPFQATTGIWNIDSVVVNSLC